MSLLKVEDLSLGIKGSKSPIVKEVSFSIEEGEIYGLLGESGSGKTLTSLSIIRLLPPDIHIISGKILFKQKDIVKLDETELKNIRGKEIGLILQDPLSALNPVLTVGEQIEEVLQGNKAERKKRAVELLKEVGLPDPEMRLKNYPHQLSGGMRQRVMIAISLARNPSLLIADEPTTALDLTLQVQIMKLLLNLNQKKGLSLLFITHDLGVMRWIAKRVGVLYKGLLIEEAEVEDLFEHPLHPYTKELMKAYSIENSIAELKALKIEETKGCPYLALCAEKTEKCYKKEVPPLIVVSTKRKVRCWHYEK